MFLNETRSTVSIVDLGCGCKIVEFMCRIVLPLDSHCVLCGDLAAAVASRGMESIVVVCSRVGFLYLLFVSFDDGRHTTFFIRGLPLTHVLATSSDNECVIDDAFSAELLYHGSESWD